MFRDQVDEFYAKLRQAEILEKAASAYYQNTDTGSPHFDELEPAVQQEWVRRVGGHA